MKVGASIHWHNLVPSGTTKSECFAATGFIHRGLRFRLQPARVDHRAKKERIAKGNQKGLLDPHLEKLLSIDWGLDLDCQDIDHPMNQKKSDNPSRSAADDPPKKSQYGDSHKAQQALSAKMLETKGHFAAVFRKPREKIISLRREASVS